MNALAQRAGVTRIDQSKVLGEPGTGYEGPKGLGEFECENCRFFDPLSSTCGQSTMKAKSKRPRTKNGRVKVDPEGCCEYVDRIGKVEEHEAEEQGVA